MINTVLRRVSTKYHYFVCVYFFLGTIFLYNSIYSILGITIKKPQSDALPVLVSKDKSSLGDGCYHVFLDVGANVGVHGRFIFEPHMYPDIKNATKEINSKYFGDEEKRDPRDVCVFAFEPNPAHKQTHLNLQEAYTKVGLRYHPIFAGVSDLDGNLTFYHKGDEDHNEWGFSTTKRGENDAEEIVPVIRLKSWLETNIRHRLIPTKPFGDQNLTTSPNVVMKMDVEGQEFIMLPDLLLSGILCQTVDFLFGELHRWGNGNVGPNPETGRGGINVAPRPFANIVAAIMRSLRNDDCKMKFSDHDDEAYLNDGIPLPSKPWWN